MNARDYLELAGELAGGSREADWRSAVSRAYYAAFHVARNLLVQVGFRPPADAQGHAYLWLRLSNTGHPDLDEVGQHLHNLRQVRGQADYQFDRPFREGLAVVQVDLAFGIIRTLDDLAATPGVLARVVDAMRGYERDVLLEVTWRAP